MSWFYTDPYLIDNCAVTMCTPSITFAVLDITVETLPDLEALDCLTINYSLGNFSVVSIKPQRPHRKKKQYTRHASVGLLEGLRIEDLVLDRNPIKTLICK